MCISPLACSMFFVLHSRPLVRPAEAGGFGLVDGGGVEFAVGWVYDGFVVVYVEREMVDFFSGCSVYVALDHGVVAYLFVLVDFDAGVGCLPYKISVEFLLGSAKLIGASKSAIISSSGRKFSNIGL